MTAADPQAWLVIEFSSRSLWLPQADAHELVVRTTDIRVAGPTESAWEPEALVPATRWRGVRTRGEARGVLGRSFRPGCDVALMKLPPAAQGLGPDLQLASLGRVDRYLGLEHDVPGMTTQTTRSAGGRRLGLHLDNWDRLCVGDRHASRNRASLNLGPEPRDFLFVDVDVVGAHPGSVVPTTKTARRLVACAEGPLAVVRLRVPVGWVYIAATENMLHDVCSLAQYTGSAHISALGCFSPIAADSLPDVVAVEVDLPPCGRSIVDELLQNPRETDHGHLTDSVEYDRALGTRIPLID